MELSKISIRTVREKPPDLDLSAKRVAGEWVEAPPYAARIWVPSAAAFCAKTHPIIQVGGTF
jgi:hypothetical protein